MGIRKIGTSSVAPELKPITGLSLTATGKTGATATAVTLAGGTASGAPTTGTHIKGELVVDDTGAGWYCTVGGTPGTWVAMGGGGGSGSVSAYYWNGSAYVADTDVRIFSGPSSQNPRTASGGRDNVNDLWVSTDAPDFSSGALIGYNEYIPAADGNVLASGSNSALTAIDATNCTVTFVAPPSGTVFVTMEAGVVMSANGNNGAWGLLEGSTQVGGQNIVCTQNISLRGRSIHKITGLTPGSTHTYKWAYRTPGGSMTVFGGPVYGSLMMNVIAVGPVLGLAIGAPGQIIGTKSYNPGTMVNTQSTSGTLADIDATNLAVGFVVPASGSVLVRLSGYLNTSSSTYAWGIREGTTDVAAGTVASSMIGRTVSEFLITGLTPGASKTYKWSHARTFGSGTPGIYYGQASIGADVGPALMTVLAL